MNIEKYKMYKFFREAEAESIPTKPGLYAFFLDLISPSKIGLAGKGPFDKETLDKARLALITRLTKHFTAISSINLIGEISQADKDPHIQASYKIIAKRQSKYDYEKEISALKDDEIRAYAELVGKVGILAQPIYVGITFNQTLLVRYNQHKSDYDLTKDSKTFGGRLRDLGVSWDDVMFACVSSETSSLSKPLLLMLENHLQATSLPLLSVS